MTSARALGSTPGGSTSRTVLDADAIRRAVRRMAHQLLERHAGAEDLGVLGIHTRGVPLARRLVADIEQIEGVTVPAGTLDVALYRDDYARIGPRPLERTWIPVDTEGLTINAFDYEGLSVKGRVGYDFGRDSDDDKHLDGLGDIGAGAVLGLDLAYDWEPVQFTVALDKTIGGADGFTAEFGAAYSVELDDFEFSIGPSHRG